VEDYYGDVQRPKGQGWCPTCQFSLHVRGSGAAVGIHGVGRRRSKGSADTCHDGLGIFAGDRITWINDSGVMHEIYFQNNPTSSGEERLRYVLTGVHKISIVVTRPGDYDYVCRWHGMWGSIRVAEKSRP
jgi:hypothetical protein